MIGISFVLWKYWNNFFWLIIRETDGKWIAAKIKNPEFKGEWKRKIIKNPNYMGKWEGLFILLFTINLIFFQLHLFVILN
jgi:hypothetical protein